MERLLEGAVEHGVTIIRDHLQALAQVQPDTLVSDNAHARGFRLEGYGIFFDVVVAVMVLGILVFRIRETFASMDVSKLNELKW